MTRRAKLTGHCASELRTTLAKLRQAPTSANLPIVYIPNRLLRDVAKLIRFSIRNICLESVLEERKNQPWRDKVGADFLDSYIFLRKLIQLII